ncbi:elongation factor TS-domain-containing protein [Lentinula aciculospora]|uniref:Elongation factor Ts, mitochondrial n=1 Tax=Lentinula aciculospora TaxID=153920 RepID=A0A9W9ALM3_9AGAR|nr:elongation factor TS-domain-containing protein [Lentinula aciculospora]
MLKFSKQAQCGRRLALHRLYSSVPATSRVQLVGELRKLSNAPIIKARQALDESNGDFDAAVRWLEEDMRKSGAAKAEKVKGRATSEGLISISVLEGGMGSRIGSGSGLVRASIIELNCESDFVSRTDEFACLANEISGIVARSQTQQHGSFSPFTSLSVENLLQLSHKTSTVGSLITDLIARIGENISLRRAMLLTSPSNSNSAYRVASYLHQGRVGALDLISLRPSQSSLFKDDTFIGDLEKLERGLAKQTAGFMTLGINEKRDPEDELETVLYEQPFMMLGGENASVTVGKVLDQWQEKWSLKEFVVSDFTRWEVGKD